MLQAVPALATPVGYTVTAADEAQIQKERKLLTPVIPPGAVVLSEATPVAYYLDNIISGAHQPACAPARQPQATWC
jgi:hypothetical protein